MYPECNPLLCDVTDVAMWQIGEWGNVSSNNAPRMKLFYTVITIMMMMIIIVIMKMLMMK